MQWRINQLNAENDRERAYHRITKKQLQTVKDFFDEALKDAKNEYDLRRQAEKNLAEANNEVDTWCARAIRAENALDSVKVTRDPKTGRMVSTKAKPRPTAKEMEKGLAEFHNMMDNAIEQLEWLTVRKLCDEVKENSSAGI